MYRFFIEFRHVSGTFSPSAVTNKRVHLRSVINNQFEDKIKNLSNYLFNDNYNSFVSEKHLKNFEPYIDTDIDVDRKVFLQLIKTSARLGNLKN